MFGSQERPKIVVFVSRDPEKPEPKKFLSFKISFHKKDLQIRPSISLFDCHPLFFKKARVF